jgi:hypothetical protein
MSRKALEYGDHHRWTDAEDSFLCVLNRFYAREPRSFAQIFNKFFGSDLPMHKIRNRFDSYLRLFGPNAFMTYRAVFLSVPFADPEDKYGAIRRTIERTASCLGIILQRLKEEILSPSVGKGRTARSPKTRKTYRALVRKASREAKAGPVQMPEVPQSPTTVPRLGGYAVATDIDSDSSEDIVDLETPSVCRKSFETMFDGHDTLPKLAFRVWDKVSKTI